MNLPPVTLISLDDVVCRIDSTSAREHSIYTTSESRLSSYFDLFSRNEFSRLVKNMRILLDAMISIEFNPISLIYSTRINHIFHQKLNCDTRYEKILLASVSR